MAKTVFVIVLAAALAAFSYLLGWSHAKTEIITEKVEVIKYVEKKKAAVYARPHAGRNALLELMRQGRL